MANVEIDNFRNSYIVKAGVSDTSFIRNRLDDIAKNLVAGECDNVLSSAGLDDSGVRIIRRLPVNLTLDIKQIDALSTPRIWGVSIARALGRELCPPYNRSNVMVFPSLSEYLASFLIDLLKGTVWQHWYYQEFTPLRKLDVKETIREVLKNNRLIVEDALLLLLEKNSLNNLFNALNRDDIENIYESYLDAVPRHDTLSYRELIPRLMKFLDDRILDVGADDLPGYENYLLFYLAAVQEFPDLKPVASLRKAVKLVFWLRHLFVKLNQQEKLEKTVVCHDLPELLSMIRQEAGASLAELPAWLGEVAGSEGKEALFTIIRDTGKMVKNTLKNRFNTAYGGIFIFFRLILEKKLHRLVDASLFPEKDHLPRIRAFLFFLGQRLAGLNETLSEVSDRGLQLFAGYENSPSSHPLNEFLLGVTPAMNRDFLESLSPLLHDTRKTIPENDVMNRHSFGETLDIVKEFLYGLLATRLGKFEKSSHEYLLENFISRRAELTLDQKKICVKLAKKPLDIILRMSGLLEDIDNIPWFDGRKFEFTLEH